MAYDPNPSALRRGVLLALCALLAFGAAGYPWMALQALLDRAAKPGP